MSTLTPMKLNEQIVSMRKSVEKARVWLCRRLIRQKKLLQKSKVEKKTRKVDRIISEIDRCKKVCRDDVSKFALINLKTLNDLLKKTKISVDERVLYKLACQEIVIKSVKEFRIKYPNWQHEVSFLLQRLGLQYKSKKDAKKYVLQQNETKEMAETSIGKIPECSQDLKMIVKKEIRKAVKKEENFEKKKKKLKDKTKSDESEEISIPVLKLPKLELPKPVIAKGQAIIKQLSLDGNQDDDFASISASDGSKDIVLQGNVDDNVNGTNDEASRSTPPVKTKDIRKRKKDFECDRSEKREDTLRQNNNSEPVSSLKRKNTKLLENQNLHPSWIAKKREHEALKKLKESCKAKKIVFGDD